MAGGIPAFSPSAKPIQGSGRNPIAGELRGTASVYAEEATWALAPSPASPRPGDFITYVKSRPGLVRKLQASRCEMSLTICLDKSAILLL